MSRTVAQPPFSDPCIVCEPLVSYAGSERYIVELAKAIKAPIYTDRVTINLPSEIEVTKITDRVPKIVFDRFTPHFRQFLNYTNFQPPKEHDVVITTGLFPKSITTYPEQRRIHLVQMIYDIFKTGANGALDAITSLYKPAMRIFDCTAANRIDHFIANSEYIARWIETAYNRDTASVIYPPVAVDEYYHESGDGYLLYLGRLAPEKRVGEIVDTISGTDYRLKVAGDGPLRKEIEKKASDKIEVLGYVEKEKKHELLANCDALLFNSEQEPFGIVIIEALASGKPVIGVNDGNVPYLIDDKVNGILFERKELLKAIDKANSVDWDPDEIMATAQKYSVGRMRNNWKQFLSGG